MSHRCGYVAIVGRPNVGKSTLLNRLVGAKVSITSTKAQTTRHVIRGVVTRPDVQFVFVDTPGFQQRHGGRLNQAMNRSVREALGAVDAVIWVVEAREVGADDRAVLALVPADVPVVAALNKVDASKDKRRLLPLISEIAALRNFAAIVPVSALRGSQLDELLDTLAGLLPEGPAMFDEDALTDRSERFLAAELVREKVFRLTGDEVPYATHVDVESFAQEGGLRRVGAVVYVRKPGHKGIVIGKGGEMLKRIATEARLDMERLFGGPVFLRIWVKVKPEWNEDRRILDTLVHE
jgi:GTP-binding protein Era